MILIDSHCHIDGEDFDEDRDEVIQRALDADVRVMLNVGTGDPMSGSFERAVELTEKYDCVYASVGVHPHDAKLFDNEAERRLRGLVSQSEKIIAWGEIGLDYYYDHSPRDVQRDVFKRQLKIARELNLPVIIHSRDADSDTVNLLREDSSKGIMHCFGGSVEMARDCLELGFLVSFAGNVTFKKADNLRDAARVVPLESLLVETDCPYLTPIPYRGKRNEPCHVVETAKFLAEFYGVDIEVFANATTENFLGFFNLDGVVLS
jgi:TatD DNase family protein